MTEFHFSEWAQSLEFRVQSSESSEFKIEVQSEKLYFAIKTLSHKVSRSWFLFDNKHFVFLRDFVTLWQLSIFDFYENAQGLNNTY